MESGKRWLQGIISIAVSVVFIWYAVRGIDFSRVAAELRQAHYLYIIPNLALMVFFQYLRGWRFHYLIAPVARIPMQALVRINNIGMMAIFILPARLGEFVRPYLLKREYGASMSASLGAVAAERVLDGLVVTLGFFALTQAAIAIPAEMLHAGIIAFAVFAGAATALGLVLFGHETGAAFIRAPIALFSTKLADRIVRMLSSFAKGLKALKDGKALVIYLAWTALFWALQGLSNIVLFPAMHIELPMIAGFVLVALTVIAVMIPAGPGFIGPIQAATVWGLGLFGVTREKAFAFSIIAHALSALVQIAFGLLALLQTHVSMSALVKESQAETSV